MPQASESQVIRTSALHEKHLHLGAILEERDGWSTPAFYGDTLFEYAAVREGGAGVIDLSPRGRIQVSGSEAVPFLNGLITNDMKTLAVNSWMPAAFPNVQGRLIASVRVVRIRDEQTGQNPHPTFLLDTEAATHLQALKAIGRFTLAGDFHVTDLTDKTAQVSVQGSRAAQVLLRVLGNEVQTMPLNGAAEIIWQQTEMTVIRGTHSAEDGFDLIVNAERAQGLWEALMKAGARPVGYDALNILRIEAGQPRYNVDMDETNVVTEALPDDAVSYTKGCYVGQEIIARIKYRGHVAKKLTGLKLDRAVKLSSGARIRSVDAKEIGTITSVTYSPHLGQTIALGYVKYDYLAPGTDVKIARGDEEIAAQVAELPFVRGSWYQPLRS